MDVSIDLQSRIARSSALVSSAIEGEVTMMNVQTGKYYGLTTVGARIWSMIEQPIPVADVCHQLMVEYRVDRARCENEVLSFLQRMADEGVIALADDPSGVSDGR